jgi:SAM-dependent methyltransferase
MKHVRPPVLPPGTLLQLLYLQDRLQRNHTRRGRFLEVGAGEGHLARLLLDHGWTGELVELDGRSAQDLATRFAAEIDAGRLTVRVGDFIDNAEVESADLIASCMVLEHLDDTRVTHLLHRAREFLRPGGVLVGLVPSSPAHWRIEDEVAGHFRRYTRATITEALAMARWRVNHLAGLTYPLSNILFGISNMLVQTSEEHKLSLSMLERTKQSGRRQVNYKTVFPAAFGLILNRWTMKPFHIIQRCFTRSDRAMVLYFEASPC